MVLLHQWDVFVNGMKYEIVFEGRKVSGAAKIRVDGKLGEYRPILVKKVGMFYLIDIVDSEFILKLDLVHNQPQALIQDGIYLDTGLPLEDDVVSRIREAQTAPDPLFAKNKAQMGSFLTFVILTFVNLFLIAVDSPFSFPFSATVPQILFGLGWYPMDFAFVIPSSVLLFLAVIFALVYLILYYLSLKKNWPILTTIILIAIDTVVLVYLSIGDFSHNIIDIAFHAWVLWSIIQLYRTRIRIKREAV